MRQRWYKLLVFSLLTCMLVASFAYAGNGKITGVITDADGQPAVGANVILEGTTLGAAADADGNYFILNVPPGTYRVRASAVGFATKVTTNVRIGSDQLITLNVTMQSEAVGLAEVVVEADRPAVDISQTTTRTRMDGDEFQNLPIRDVEDLIATSASTYKGYIRGGKVFETKVLVDGIDMTDQYASWYNQVAGTGGVFMVYNGVANQQAEGSKSGLVSLSTSSVEEASVVTGGMGADYRSATAGVVSYNLREGRGDLAGRVYVRMSQMGGLSHLGTDLYADQDVYFQQKADLAASADQGAQDKATRFTYYPGKYPYKTRPEMLFDFGVGGALSDNFRMYLTGGYFQSSYRLPNQSTKRINGSLKLTYDFTSDMKLAFTGIMEDRGKLFGWKNTTYSDDYRFFLEGSPQWNGMNFVGSLKWTHALSPETYYTVQFDYLNDQTGRGYSDDDGDGIITAAEAFTTDGDFMEFADTAMANANSARTQGSDFGKFFSPAPRNEPGSEVGVNFSGQGN
ncbi:MAG: carboxypeptidase-like regulatory domain-containing protein, partial [Bacteroidota bacterium]